MDFTQEQLAEIEKLKQEAVEKAVKDKEEELTKKHNDLMASTRKKYDDEKAKAVERAVKEANMSTEDKAKARAEELMKEKEERLSFLEKEYKKSTILSKLRNSQVPDMFANDSRLWTATNEELDSVVATIKEEFSKLMPSGSQIDTNFKTAGSGDKKSEKQKKFEQFSKMQ